MIKVAINGFGRIGRNFLRVVLSDEKAQDNIVVTAINIGPANPELIAYMFTYDTIMGTYKTHSRMEGNYLVVGKNRIRIFAEKDPLKLPWKELGINWVVEASGHFTSKEKALQHIQAGASHVLITAPAKNEDITIIPGVNGASFDANTHQIVSLGSCTTNALAPLLKLLDDAFTLQYGCMTTVHAYTNTQVLLDVEAEGARRSRAAALNIIPTSTGAMNLIGKILPRLQGRIQAVALRVPVANVSLIDLSFTTEKVVSVEHIHKVFSNAAETSMKNILHITTEPLVSSDFIGDAHSVIVDSQLTSISGSHMGKVFGWYDNEWGYSTRLKDFLMICA